MSEAQCSLNEQARLKAEDEMRRLNICFFRSMSIMREWEEVQIVLKAMEHLEWEYENETKAIKGRNYLSKDVTLTATKETPNDN